MTELLAPVVYTMGKVASSSVSDAIIAAGLPCYDIHSLNPEYLQRTARSWLERGEYPPPHICVSMAHRDRLLVKRKKCLYISLVRDPIARNLSAFFQNLHLEPMHIRTEENPQKLFDHFVNNYGHSVPMTWFEREFETQLSIDIFSKPFDREKKFVRLPGKHVVLFRVDCPDDVKGRVLTQELGRKITIRRQNDSANKDYFEKYGAIKDFAKFPESFLSRIYDSKFAQHFWTYDERQAFKAKWTG